MPKPDSPTWLERLTGLFARLSPPGTHASMLEEARLGALLDKELGKPSGQRDEELVHTLRVQYRKRQLKNTQAWVGMYAHLAVRWKHSCLRCCAAGEWVQRRMAASFRARYEYHCQDVQQTIEELASAEARRPAVIVALPVLHLYLPEALQQPPPRLDMCSVCARQIQTAELAEERCRLTTKHTQQLFQGRGLKAAPSAASAKLGEAGCSAAAAAAAAGAGCPVGEDRQGQQAQQQQGSGDSRDCDAEGASVTP